MSLRKCLRLEVNDPCMGHLAHEKPSWLQADVNRQLRSHRLGLGLQRLYETSSSPSSGSGPNNGSFASSSTRRVACGLQREVLSARP
jgi:hypothetical protein